MRFRRITIVAALASAVALAGVAAARSSQTVTLSVEVRFTDDITSVDSSVTGACRYDLTTSWHGALRLATAKPVQARPNIGVTARAPYTYSRRGSLTERSTALEPGVQCPPRPLPHPGRCAIRHATMPITLSTDGGTLLVSAKGRGVRSSSCPGIHGRIAFPSTRVVLPSGPVATGRATGHSAAAGERRSWNVTAHVTRR